MFDYVINMFLLIASILALYTIVLVILELRYLKEIKRFEKITKEQEIMALQHLQE